MQAYGGRLRRCCKSHPFRNYRLMGERVAPELPILYEDAHIIAVNKPWNMLSVPGKPEAAIMRPRHEEWRAAVTAAHEATKGLPSIPCEAVLQRISAEPLNVPRKEKKFYDYLRRTFQVRDAAIAAEAWNYVNIVDKQMNFPPIDLSKANISATEIVRSNHSKVLNVHRLDCETSGVLLMALTEDASAHLSSQFRDGMTTKRYIAIVSGHIENTLNRVDVAIRGDPDDRPRQVVDEENGKESETLVRLLGHQTDDAGFMSSVVELTPITGRTHQLRVHMSHIGHPILGDTLYATGSDLEKSPRLLLHAYSLNFVHPVDNRSLTMIAPCPFLPPGIAIKDRGAEETASPPSELTADSRTE